MFWKFGFHSSSPIDSLLEKSNITLVEILEQESLLQEVKGQNDKVLAFLAKQENLKELLGLLTVKSKLSFLAIEILSCDVEILYSGLFQYSLLQEFWEFLDQDVILDINASYFLRLNMILLQKRPKEMFEFLKSTDNVVQKMLKHIKTTSITDIIMKLISMEDIPEGMGVVDVRYLSKNEWLAEQGLIEKLVEYFDPRNGSFLHALASQAILDIIAISFNVDPSFYPQDQSSYNSLKSQLIDKLRSKLVLEKLVGYMTDRSHEDSKSSLTHGINIIMELVRRYCSEVERLEAVFATCQAKNLPCPSLESIPFLSICISDVFVTLGLNMVSFIEILKVPHDVDGPVETSMGLLEPVGSERLKTCELIAELVHCQYLLISSPLFESLVQYYPIQNSKSEGSESDEYYVRAIDGLLGVTEILIEENVFEITVDLFFRFQWNNFLHSVVYDMIAKVLNSYSFILSVITPALLDVDISDTNNLSVGQKTMMKARDLLKMLVLSIFEKGKVTLRILDSHKLNCEQESLQKGVRIGYMGHLTYLSDEVIKLTDKCGQDLGEKFQEYVFDDNWINYITGPLREIKERDQKLLGGVRPDHQAMLPQVIVGFPGEGPVEIQDGGQSYGDPDAFRTNWDFNPDVESATQSDTEEQKPFYQTEAAHDISKTQWDANTAENEIDFDVNEAFHSDTNGLETAPITFKKEGNSTWKADFEGAFGTEELRSSLDSIKSTKSFKDAPGEEWTEFSSSEGS